MHISYSYIHIDSSPALEQYFAKKLETIAAKLSRFDTDNAGECVVEFAKTTEHHQHGNIYRAEVTLAIPTHTFRADATGEDMYAAIDAVRDLLTEQVARYKELETDKRHGNA